MSRERESCNSAASAASSYSGVTSASGGPVRSGSVHTPKRLRHTLPGNSGATTITAIHDDKSTDYLCPICKSVMEAAHITSCGHTFCHSCITNAVDNSRKCPLCYVAIPDRDSLIPNFLLNDLITKYKSKLNGLETLGLSRDSSGEFINAVDGLRDFVASESEHLTLPDVNVILEVLTHRKQLLEAESSAAQNKLLLEFLRHLRCQKMEQKDQILRELELVERDIGDVEQKLRDVHGKCTIQDSGGISNDANKDALKLDVDKIGSTICEAASAKKDDCTTATSSDSNLTQTGHNFNSLWQRIYTHFDDFVQCYFASRYTDLYFGKDSVADCTNGRPATRPTAAADTTSSLDEFCDDLMKFSRYSSLRSIASLNYSSDLFNNSTIVSSIEFDKDNEFFAIAGVTKRIKVYHYGTVTRDSVDIHYPCMEMISNSKISCVSWNSYHKETLASSDYEGTVTVWDSSTGQAVKVFQEHEKRCWSVDFNDVDTRLIASGSDDARVKLYSLNMDHSIATLEARANICCVKFNPKSSHHLAYGSADHCVHYYDLRNMKEAVIVFKGHKKAVSYVKFLNSETIVSASTDSQLKMWNVTKPYCLRSFTGHVNEKNFVGLGTDGDYIACGSENNSLFVYYKGLARRLFSYKFEAARGVLDNERPDEDANEFVSAVCWKQQSNVVLAANSQGTINILELV